MLSYTELCELVEAGVIRGVRDGAINASSIDIHLGPMVLVEAYQKEERGPISYSKREPLLMRGVDISEGSFIIHPEQFILASSIETFHLPPDISAQYRLKSSMARIGLEHLNAGHCFVGSTEIPLLDGTSRTIESLVGETPWVYSLDEAGEFVPGKASRVWKTKDVTETVVVTLNDGSTFKCTPEHRIMLRDGAYCEAQFLVAGQPLMPLYRKTGQYGYEWVYCPSTVRKSNWIHLRGRWKKTHTLTDAALNGALPKDMAVHHKDHNRTNNSPENLERMNAIEHATLHCVERNKTEEMRSIARVNGKSTGTSMWADEDFRKMKTENNRRNAAFTNNKRWGTPIPVEYLNHTVTSVERVTHESPIPVYDMTVDRWHNFAIGAGVFVHNCDAGWNNSVLTLELKNVTRYHAIHLQAGDPIGQMVFWRHTPVPEDKSYAVRGRYNSHDSVMGIVP